MFRYRILTVSVALLKINPGKGAKKLPKYYFILFTSVTLKYTLYWNNGTTLLILI